MSDMSSKAEKATERVCIRLTPTELEILNKKAGLVKLSDYIRLLLSKGMEETAREDI